jgi:hypothetical protein
LERERQRETEIDRDREMQIEKACGRHCTKVFLATCTYLHTLRSSAISSGLFILGMIWALPSKLLSKAAPLPDINTQELLLFAILAALLDTVPAPRDNPGKDGPVGSAFAR